MHYEYLGCIGLVQRTMVPKIRKDTDRHDEDEDCGKEEGKELQKMRLSMLILQCVMMY